jgi:hypothetical protein
MKEAFLKVIRQQLVSYYPWLTILRKTVSFVLLAVRTAHNSQLLSKTKLLETRNDD